MQLKQLKWLDNVSDGVVVACHSIVKVYSSITIEFQINHCKDENIYYLYSFGKGSIRRLEPDRFNTVDEAKTAAFEIYNNEMQRMKRRIDSFWEDEVNIE